MELLSLFLILPASQIESFLKWMIINYFANIFLFSPPHSSKDTMVFWSNVFSKVQWKGWQMLSLSIWESQTETDGLGKSQVSLCTVPELSNLTFSRSGEGRSHTWCQSGTCLLHSNLFFNHVFISTPLYFAFPQQLRNTTFIFNS